MKILAATNTGGPLRNTQAFGQQASRAIGNYAAEKLQEANNLRTQGKEDETRTRAIGASRETGDRPRFRIRYA